MRRLFPGTERSVLEISAMRPGVSNCRAAPRFTEEFRACGANMRSYAAPVFSCSGTVRA
ncbi:MAG: hypothetical protein V8T38_16005 [Oscillospiraceae bacterium]